MTFIKAVGTTAILAFAWLMAISAAGFVVRPEPMFGWTIAGIMACGPAAVLWYAVMSSSRSSSGLVPKRSEIAGSTWRTR